MATTCMKSCKMADKSKTYKSCVAFVLGTYLKVDGYLSKATALPKHLMSMILPSMFLNLFIFIAWNKLVSQELNLYAPAG